MKATAAVLVVVILLVSRNVAAQCTPGSLPAGFQLFNYGRTWNAWSKEVRSIFLRGFVEGQSKTYMTLEKDLPEERREPLKRQTFMFYDSNVLRNVMTSLYSDPANTYIAYGSMVYIARDRLEGKDVAVALRNARQKDCGGDFD